MNKRPTIYAWLAILFLVAAAVYAADEIVSRTINYQNSTLKFDANTSIKDVDGSWTVGWDKLKSLADGTIGAGLTGAVSVAQGGTGATNVSGAKAALGVDIVNIKDYGAVADDSVSDFDAIEQAAQVAMNSGKILWIPAGTFNMDEGDVIEVFANIQVEGAGDAAIIKQAGESATTATEIFRITGATNVFMRGFQLQNARYAISFRQPMPTRGKVRLENLRFSGNRAGIYYLPPEPWSLTEQVLDRLAIIRCSFVGVSTTKSAGIDLYNPAISEMLVEGCDFRSGQYGVSVQGYQMPTNQIPQQKIDKVVIRGSSFSGQDHATAAHNAIYIADVGAAIEDCVFHDGSTGGSSSTDQAAIRMASIGGVIRHCVFQRWGNNTDKPVTVYLSGPGTEFNQFTGPSLTFNYDPGWGASVRDCYFGDTYGSGTATGCGQIYLETDHAAIDNNIWEYIYLDTKPCIYWKNVSPWTTVPKRMRVVNNSMVRCYTSSQFMEVNGKSQGLDFINNSFIGVAGTGGYCLQVDQVSYDYTIHDNKISDSANLSLLRLATSSSSLFHTSYDIRRNSLTNCLYGITTTSGSSGNAGFLTNVVIADNRFLGVNTPIYALSYATWADSRICNNLVRSNSFAIPRLGTSPAFVNCEIYANGYSLAERTTPFLGTAATAPTYPVTGGIWLSNAVTAYIYSGAAWLPLN